MPKRKSPWPMQPLGDLLTRVVRPVDVDEVTTYREIGIRSHGKGIFHKPETTGKQIGNKRVFWIEPGCFVFNIIFAWEQAVATTSEAEVGMIASHRFPMYRSRNGKLLTEYVCLYFRSPRGKYDLGIASPGGAGRNKTLGQEEFKRLSIPVPPIEYQRLALDVMATWDRAIEQMNALIAAKRKLKKGLAQQLLTGKLRLTRFRREWQESSLGKIATILLSGVDKKSQEGEKAVQLCNYMDVYYNDRITRDIEFMEATASDTEIEKYSLKKSDVIITKDSETPDDIAKPAVVVEDMPDVICGYHLAILRPKQQLFGPFLAQFLRLPRIRHEFFRLANGATRFGLGQSSLRQLKLYYPSLPEQERIAAVLGVADREIALLETEVTRLQEQKKGLMQQLLTDKLGRKVTKHE